jgi:hypothetical protein
MELSNTTTTPTNTHIVDSCCVISKQAMRDYLLKLRESVPDEMAVCQRDVESMVREWRSHNLFYKLHIFRSRTHDVDLEVKQAWYRELFCRVVSCLYFWD